MTVSRTSGRSTRPAPRQPGDAARERVHSGSGEVAAASSAWAPRIRRSIAAAATRAQPYVRRWSASLLRARVFQRLLNLAEERAGDIVLYPRRDFRVSDLAEFFLHSPDVRQPFVWGVEFAGRSYFVPVEREFPHPPPRNVPWGPAFYWHRPDNRKLRALYRLVLRRWRAGTFLDIGANWGFHAYPFAAHGYRCVCFEPQSICCDFIDRIRALNRFDNLHIMRSGVGSTRLAAVPFFESEVEAFSSLDERHVASFRQPFTSSTIDLVTIDDVCADQRLSPTLVKIDAEGSEWEIVRGGLTVLETCQPVLVVEVSCDAEAQRALWAALAERGYRCFWPTSQPPAQPRFVRIADADQFVNAGLRADGTRDPERDFVFAQQHHRLW